MRFAFPFSSLRFPLAWAAMGAFALSSLADPPAPSYPQWWLDYSLVQSQPPDPEDEEQEEEFAAWMESNYAPANLGQLKNLAAQARTYLDDKLYEVGGAGPDIAEMIAGWGISSEANYAPVNLGQLKAVAQPFYERLQAVGFDTRQSLLDHGATLDEGQELPWPTPPPAYGEEGYDEGTFDAWMAKHYQPANLGQLKLVFTFDLDAWAATKDWSTVDADDDGLPDSWEITHGLSPFDDGSDDVNNGAEGDPDEDLISNADEYNGGVDSTDPFDEISGPESAYPNFVQPPWQGLTVTNIKIVVEEETQTLQAGKLYLRWPEFTGVAPYQMEYKFQRRQLSHGTAGVPLAWGNITLNVTTADGFCTATDEEVDAGHRYQYRLRVNEWDTMSETLWGPPTPGYFIQPLPPPAGVEDPEWEVAGYDDYDSDGLSNQEELDYATDPTDPDSDGDGFQDGADAFATQREFKLPRQPTPHYAVLDLGEGEVVDMNDAGDVLIKLVTTEGNVTTTTYRVWSGGANLTLPETGSGNETINWRRLGRDTTSNHTIAMGLTRIEYDEPGVGEVTYVRTPVYLDVDAETPMAVEAAASALLAVGGGNLTGTSLGQLDEYTYFFGRDGQARFLAAYFYGMETPGAGYLLAFGPGGLSTEDGPLELWEAAETHGPHLTLEIARLPDGQGGEDVLEMRFYPTAPGDPTTMGGVDEVARGFLNGQEISRLGNFGNIDSFADFPLEFYRALADRFARWGDKIVLALDPTPQHPTNLAYQAAPAAPLQYMTLPADPRVTDVAAEIEGLNSLGLMIAYGGSKLSVNSKDDAFTGLLAEGSVGGNETVALTSIARGGVNAAATIYSTEEVSAVWNPRQEPELLFGRYNFPSLHNHPSGEASAPSYYLVQTAESPPAATARAIIAVRTQIEAYQAGSRYRHAIGAYEPSQLTRLHDGPIPAVPREHMSDPAKLQVPVNDDNNERHSIYVETHPADNDNNVLKLHDPDVVRIVLKKIQGVTAGNLTFSVNDANGTVTLAASATTQSGDDIRIFREIPNTTADITSVSTAMPWTLDFADPGSSPLADIVNQDIVLYIEGITPSNDLVDENSVTHHDLTVKLTIETSETAPGGVADELKLRLLATKKRYLKIQYNGFLASIPRAGGVWDDNSVKQQIQDWLQYANGVRTVRRHKTVKEDVMVPVVFRLLMPLTKDTDPTHSSWATVASSGYANSYLAAYQIANTIPVYVTHDLVNAGGVAYFPGKIFSVALKDGSTHVFAHEWLHALANQEHIGVDYNLMLGTPQFSTEIANGTLHIGEDVNATQKNAFINTSIP